MPGPETDTTPAAGVPLPSGPHRRPSGGAPSQAPWFALHTGENQWERGLALVVVDRDRQGLEIRDYLRERGYRTVVRVGGAEALRAMAQEEPDLVVLDCWQRPLDPLSVLASLSDQPALRRLCLVVRAPSLTSASDPLVRRQGARAVLDRDRLLEDLASWIEHGPPTNPRVPSLSRTSTMDRAKSAERLDTMLKGPVSLGPGLCIADRFVLERQLGSGSTASVFLARDTELVDCVAIKVMRESERIRSQALRFRREARVCRQLQHPNIVLLYEFGSWRGLLYLTMEYVPGRTVRHLIDTAPDGLPVARVLSIARQATAGLVAAHAAGIAHRDIKPGNLMELPSGALKIMDFGLARGAPTGLDGSDSRWVVGTPHYLAPERLKGAPEPCLSGDVWSLGAVLYEAACGRAPFEGKELDALLKDIMEARAVPLHERQPLLPRAAADTIMSLLEKKPSDRPSDLSAVARRFGQLHRAMVAGTR